MKAFACPQCGASLESGPVKSSTVECPYCHSAVIVPTELRPPPPPPPPPLFQEYEQQHAPAKPTPAFGKILVAGCVGIVVFLIFLTFVIKPPRTTPSAPTPRSSLLPSPAKASPSPYPLTFGGEGTGPGYFQEAQHIAIDGDGNIYVSDETKRIQKFDANGRYLSVWTVPSETKYFSKVRGGPDQLLASLDGKVYVVIGGVVLKYNGADGELLGAAHGSDFIHDAALKADGGMAIISSKGDDDELVVLDANGKAITRVHRFLSSQLDKQVPVNALKVAVDGVGNIFAIYALGSVYGEHWYDDDDLAVFRFSPEGKYLDRFGGGGNHAGQFRLPSALAVDLQSRVYVGDRTSGIHVFTQEGRFLETLGSPVWAGAIAFDTAGDLFVVGSNTVSKLSLNKTSD